jgi:DNA helicase-2/ATP-dependent DNA helicase PcrA
MILTETQRAAVVTSANVLLTACPGSGKTRAIIAKLLRCVSDIRDTAHRVACITYTNPAVHEIEHRLRTFGTNGDDDYCDISTIHSFCLNNILQPFAWRLEEYAERPQVLPSDSERYAEIVDAVRSDYGLNADSREAFTLLNREPDGTPIVSGDLTEEIALDFWGRLAGEGAIDFPNIVYFSYKLLHDNPRIAEGLASKFKWILVDEFQDTSALQVEILSLIAAHGKSRFFLVGDPHQSIYSFASARPDLMFSFAKQIQAEDNFQLIENFRSSASIVTHAERLCPRQPPMTAVGDDSEFPFEPTYVHSPTAFQAITEEFLPTLAEHGIAPGDAAVLAPSWFKLMPLGRGLREFGIPVVGPGARPYRRTRLIAPLAETICGYLQRPQPQLIPIIERDLFFLIGTATGRRPYRIFSYAGRCIVCRLLSIGRELREESESGVAWLRQAAINISTELTRNDLLPNSCGNALIDSVAEMEQDMQRNGVDLNNLTVEELGLFACPDTSLKLLTMHSSKGREFDAVALVDLHERRIPNRWAIDDEDAMAEAKRLLYVAATRAKKVLMYVTDKDNDWHRPSRFLVQDLGVC